MGSIAAELQLSGCRNSLIRRESRPETSSHSGPQATTSRSRSLSTAAVESIGPRKLGRGSSLGNRFPGIRCREPTLWSRKRWGESGGRTRRRAAMAAVQMLWGGKTEAPKPSSVALEPITGEESFDRVLGEAGERRQVVVVDWLASWCRKCIYLKPKLEKLAAEYYPDIKFYSVDVNAVPQALVKRANVTKMPTIQLWKDGQHVAEVIGGHQAWLVMDEVRHMIDSKK